MKITKNASCDDPSQPTSGVPQQPGLGERVWLGFLEGLGQAVYLDGAAGVDEALLEVLLLVAVLAEPLLPLPPLQDDVDVARDQRRELLALGRLHAVVLVLTFKQSDTERYYPDVIS